MGNIEYQKAKEVALKMDKLVNSQLGSDNNYIIGVGVSRVDNSKHSIPKNYDKDFYICVMGADDMPTPKELKLLNKLEGMLIFHEQVDRPQFANN